MQCPTGLRLENNSLEDLCKAHTGPIICRSCICLSTVAKVRSCRRVQNALSLILHLYHPTPCNAAAAITITISQSHNTVSLSEKQRNPQFLPDMSWLFKTKFCSPTVPVYTRLSLAQVSPLHFLVRTATLLNPECNFKQSRPNMFFRGRVITEHNTLQLLLYINLL